MLDSRGRGMLIQFGNHISPDPWNSMLTVQSGAIQDWHVVEVPILRLDGSRRTKWGWNFSNQRGFDDFQAELQGDIMIEGEWILQSITWAMGEATSLENSFYHGEDAIWCLYHFQLFAHIWVGGSLVGEGSPFNSTCFWAFSFLGNVMNTLTT